MEKTTIEITEEKKKIGAGIITMSVLYLLGQVINIWSSIKNLINIDEVNATNAALKQMGLDQQITQTDLIISLVLALIMLTSIILILFKKSIGVFLFAGITVLNVVYSLIVSNFNVFTLIGTIIGLIFPALMLFFIYKKKDIYFGKE